MNYFVVLGLLGSAGSGKDLVADWFVDKKNFVKIAFADSMKRFVNRAFGIDPERLWGPSEKRNEMFDVSESWWYETIGHFGEAAEEIINKVLPEGKRVEGYLKLHDWFSTLRKSYPDRISARFILQTMGTEWGRAVDPLMWAKYTHQIVQQLKADRDVTYSQMHGVSRSHGTSYQGVVIPDHRFANEVEYTKSHGGYVMKLCRLANEKAEAVGISGHQSEAEQKSLPDDVFDHILYFPEGVDKVYEALEGAYVHQLWIDTRNPR